ncbi:MAG: hypothetical protein HS132_18110 [Planctomycetia bacterium]|nr:hypothetical protein [Planctomycetia bacterium]
MGGTPLSEAGLIKEKRDELRDDKTLERVYKEKFNTVYELGFVNIIDRPTRDITGIKKHEELPAVKDFSYYKIRDAEGGLLHRQSHV